MSIWRRLTAAGILLLALALLVTIEHGPRGLGEHEVAHTAAVELHHDHPCTPGPTCAPFLLVLHAEAWSREGPSAPADHWVIVEPAYLAPYLTDDTPPPRRTA